MINQETIKARRQEILDVAEKHGAHDVRIFGSVARGDQREGSDLDLLVRFDPERSLLDHGGLAVDLEDLLGVPVDVISENGMRERFRQTFAREAVPL